MSGVGELGICGSRCVWGFLRYLVSSVWHCCSFFYLQRALSFEIVELDVKIVRETKQRYSIIVSECLWVSICSFFDVSVSQYLLFFWHGWVQINNLTTQCKHFESSDGFFWVCVCVCAWACMCTCVCVCVHMCVHACVHVCVCACVCMHVWLSECVCVWSCSLCQTGQTLYQNLKISREKKHCLKALCYTVKWQGPIPSKFAGR